MPVVRTPKPRRQSGVRKIRTVIARISAHYRTPPWLSLFLCRTPRKQGIVIVRSRTITEVETQGTTFNVKTDVPENVLLENTLKSDTRLFEARDRNPLNTSGPTFGSIINELKWQTVANRRATRSSRWRLLTP